MQKTSFATAIVLTDRLQLQKQTWQGVALMLIVAINIIAETTAWRALSMMQA